MADRPWDNALADILARYGEGYQSPATTGDSEIYDTSNVLGRMRQTSPLTQGMRGLADILARASVPDNILAGGLNSGANWLDRKPEVGKDTLTPLGISAATCAPLSLRAGVALRPSSPAELPKSAAIKIGDRIFQGFNHGAAVEHAESVLGPDAIWAPQWNKKRGYDHIEEGFVTENGKFITRAEAAAAVRATKATEDVNVGDYMHASDIPAIWDAIRRWGR